LPRNAARLLAAMFPTEDVCRRSLDDIATTGAFNRKTLSATLKRLVEAGFLSRETGAGSTPDIYELHLPPVQQ
jgi:DNA-binding MarR family transcriptional regulator